MNNMQLQQSLQEYVKVCFKGAFKAENRKYDDNLWEFEWIVIESQNTTQFYPVTMWCNYARVLNRVIYRLKNNLTKNFNIVYGNTDKLSCSFTDVIDYNLTQFMFKSGHRKYTYMSIIDDKVRNEPDGICMPAYRYEKMVFNYFDIEDATEYRTEFLEKGKELFLPSVMSWNTFTTMYKNSLGVSAGADYVINIHSSGIKVYNN